jgi:hypothetical protein
MKTKLTAAATLAVGLMFSAGAVARYTELPKRFWGEWIPIDGSYPVRMKLSGTTVNFGPSPCRFTNIELANEEETAFDVKWHCPESAAGVETRTLFRLMKIWGKEALVSVNVEDPTAISVYQRKNK